VRGQGHRPATTLARFLVLAALLGGTTSCGTAARALDVEDVYARTVAAKTTQFTLDLHINAPRAGTYVTAQGDVDLTGAGFAIAVQEAGLSVQELLRGDRLYLEVPNSARAATGGKPWAEFALRAGQAPGPGAGTEPQLMESVLLAVDPAPVLHLLRLAPARAIRLGAGLLDGERTRDYRLSYPTSELASTSPGDELRAGLVSLLAQIAHPRPAEVPVYVRLDGRGRLVALQVSVVLGTEPPSPSPAQAALANQLPTTLSVGIYLDHFGAPVRVVPPTPARTKELPLSQLESGTL
jgi:hypothetical protein